MFDHYSNLVSSSDQGHCTPSRVLLCIHYMLSYTLLGRGDSIGVVSGRDFDFLLSMVDGFHLHLEYQVVISIAYQGTSSRIGALFVRPYITRLFKHIGLY